VLHWRRRIPAIMSHPCRIRARISATSRSCLAGCSFVVIRLEDNMSVVYYPQAITVTLPVGVVQRPDTFAASAKVHDEANPAQMKTSLMSVTARVAGSGREIRA